MRNRRLTALAAAGVLLALTACSAAAPSSADPTSTGSVSPSSVSSGAEAEVTGVTVTISGGFETDPVDGGRPVVLIAAALGVPTETFRTAFSGVDPADPGTGPTGDEAQANKAALLNVLGPLGITNDQLDDVSDHYRYNGAAGETWPQRTATATATVTDGVVTAITVTDPGVGYSSSPTVTVTGASVSAAAVVSYGTDLDSNGSLSAITLS